MEIVGDSLSIGLLFSALFFGLRHGIDWDHIAAITDIAATQDSPRRGFRMGTVYVLGHAAVVLTLGIIVIAVGSTIPNWLDAAMGKVVGWTLLIMGAWVIYTLLRDRGEFRMRSRWMMLFDGVRKLRSLVSTGSSVTHDHDHAAVAGVHHDGTDEDGGSVGTRVKAPTHRHSHSHEGDLGTAAIAGVGALHGIGAETPTQLVIFLAAANAGGVTAGLLVLAAFIVGLVISNSVITVVSAVSFKATSRNSKWYTALGATTAAVSVVVGALFVFGAEGSLPVWFAG